MHAIDVVKGFIAGFLSTLTFHQTALLLLHRAGVTAREPFSLEPVPPFGVPSIISLAFWGGVWGIALLAVLRPARQGAALWPTAIVFGAIAPTLVAWFIVAPLKGLPMAADWKPAPMLTGVAVNAAWGLGTAMFLQLFRVRQ